MVADVGFKRQLWALDKELDVVWDWASQKWEIWKFPGQGLKVKKRIDEKAYHIMTIQTKKRTFRQLGADIILKLQQGDPHKYGLKELISYFDQMDENITRAKERDFKNKMDSMHEETFWYTRGLRKTVPFSYQIKPSEEQLLVKTPVKQRENHYILKVPPSVKLRNAIAGGD